MQILAKIINDPINSSGIFAAALGLCIWHGLYWHCGIEIPQLALTLTAERDVADSGLPTTADSGSARRNPKSEWSCTTSAAFGRPRVSCRPPRGRPVTVILVFAAPLIPALDR